MKSRLVTYLSFLILLALYSCGVVNSVLEQNARVQTTFFGASFGDKDEYAVRDNMQDNGIGLGWRFVNKETWGISHVSFAGHDWENTLVRFTDKRFSSITFSDTFSTKAEALKMLDEIRNLLQKKYKLQKGTNNKNEPVFLYKDSFGNMVFVTAAKLKLENSDLWTCGINYSWYKASQIAEEKTMSEI